MHSINPFLRAFFKSSLVTQCNPAVNHILLVPTTECLLTGRDREAGAIYADITSSEEFLASHILRISTSDQGGETNVRNSREKAKQFNTINGRTVVVKESFVYSNKGSQDHMLLMALAHYFRLQNSQPSAALVGSALLP